MIKTTLAIVAWSCLSFSIVGSLLTALSINFAGVAQEKKSKKHNDNKKA